MHARLRVPEIDVQHVRQPRDRIPADRARSQGPADRIGGQTARNVWVFIDELCVVIVQEGVRSYLRENDQREDDEPRQDPEMWDWEGLLWGRLQPLLFPLPFARHRAR